MQTINDVFAYFKQSLVKHYDDREIEAITLLTISEICNLSKAKIKAFPELELSLQQLEKLNDISTRLQTSELIQYILGKTEFYGLPFNVNPSVLIPRPETEELVEWVISSVGSGELGVVNGEWAVMNGKKSMGRILDIGSGSGCIAISLKKNLPGFNVSSIDISKSALKTAKENARLNEVDIDFIEADILNKALWPQISNPESQISIIVSNPPYVILHDKTKMHTNVTDFEPHNALFVPEDDPLIFYKAIADYALLNLSKNGLLFFEINESYGNDIVGLLADKGFKNIGLRKDLSGRDRMIRAEFSASGK